MKTKPKTKKPAGTRKSRPSVIAPEADKAQLALEGVNDLTQVVSAQRDKIKVLTEELRLVRELAERLVGEVRTLQQTVHFPSAPFPVNPSPNYPYYYQGPTCQSTGSASELEGAWKQALTKLFGENRTPDQINMGGTCRAQNDLLPHAKQALPDWVVRHAQYLPKGTTVIHNNGHYNPQALVVRIKQ